jgi:hypothetical protein
MLLRRKFVSSGVGAPVAYGIHFSGYTTNLPLIGEPQTCQGKLRSKSQQRHSSCGIILRLRPTACANSGAIDL